MLGSNKGIKIIVIIDLILMFAAFVTNIVQLFLLKNTNVFMILLYVLKAAAVVCGILYILYGCKKMRLNFSAGM